MRMSLLIYTFTLLLSAGACKNSESPALDRDAHVQQLAATADTQALSIKTGAEQMDLWLKDIQGKTVGLVVNQTSVVGNKHLVDTLVALGVNIATIFAPEHGFRGTEDAGATILNAKDTETGIPVLSLYGNKKKPTSQDLADIDVLIFDIQDVGARFYTYISTLHYVMEACAENNKPLIVLDRPNPNGFYVDGPVLKSEFSSFVGMHPVPIVHGMTIGEYAQMINGEGWLSQKIKCTLRVIPCAHYDHTMLYNVPIAPSPNLRTMKAIHLYPSLCLFEGTNVSVGRGTDRPFEIYGSPYISNLKLPDDDKPAITEFTPKSGPGAKMPPFMNTVCYGTSIDMRDEYLVQQLNHQLWLTPLLNAYASFTDQSKFFLDNNFFNKLAGNTDLMQQVKAGLTAEEIRMSWQDDLIAFKQIRKKYLLYPDFE
ncbi:MAG TPA: DUF1343 domain-containing protein [Chitinophagales bacterium]|nr:DUF1343 domain-containing protein [Chitinophagales bacterium]